MLIHLIPVRGRCGIAEHDVENHGPRLVLCQTIEQPGVQRTVPRRVQRLVEFLVRFLVHVNHDHVLYRKLRSKVEGEVVTVMDQINAETDVQGQAKQDCQQGSHGPCLGMSG